MTWKIHHGEALEVLARLPDASVDAVITDPPYSSGGAFRGDRMGSTTMKYVQTGQRRHAPPFVGDNRDQRSFAYWCALWLSECARVAKPGAPIAMLCDWRQLPSATDALQAGGWVWRGICPWNKGRGVRPQRGRFRNQCEYVLWGSNGAMPIRGATLDGFFECAVTRGDKFHQAGKPLDLMRRLVAVCPPGGVVLDPFAGSGSTLVAALLEGRQAIGVERCAPYVAIARARCAEPTAAHRALRASTLQARASSRAA